MWQSQIENASAFTSSSNILSRSRFWASWQILLNGFLPAHGFFRAMDYTSDAFLIKELFSPADRSSLYAVTFKRRSEWVNEGQTIFFLYLTLAFEACRKVMEYSARGEEKIPHETNEGQDTTKTTNIRDGRDFAGLGAWYTQKREITGHHDTKSGKFSA